MNEWILGRVFGIPRTFAGVDKIITNLVKERETAIEMKNDSNTPSWNTDRSYLFFNYMCSAIYINFATCC